MRSSRRGQTLEASTKRNGAWAGARSAVSSTSLRSQAGYKGLAVGDGGGTAVRYKGCGGSGSFKLRSTTIQKTSRTLESRHDLGYLLVFHPLPFESDWSRCDTLAEGGVSPQGSPQTVLG